MSNDLIVYFWVLLLSITGGTAHHIRKIKSGAINKFSFTEWFGDIFISGFVGLLTYWMCSYYNFSMEITAVCIGVSSHLGTRSIVLFEDVIIEKFKFHFKK